MEPPRTAASMPEHPYSTNQLLLYNAHRSPFQDRHNPKYHIIFTFFTIIIFSLLFHYFIYYFRLLHFFIFLTLISDLPIQNRIFWLYLTRLWWCFQASSLGVPLLFHACILGPIELDELFYWQHLMGNWIFLLVADHRHIIK